MDDVPEVDAVNGQGDDVGAGVATRAAVGDLVEQFEQLPPWTLPEKLAMSGVISTVIDSDVGRVMGSFAGMRSPWVWWWQAGCPRPSAVL